MTYKVEIVYVDGMDLKQFRGRYRVKGKMLI